MLSIEFELFQTFLFGQTLVYFIHHGQNLVHAPLDLLQAMGDLADHLELLTILGIFLLLLHKTLHQQVDHKIELYKINNTVYNSQHTCPFVHYHGTYIFYFDRHRFLVFGHIVSARVQMILQQLTQSYGLKRTQFKSLYKLKNVANPIQTWSELIWNKTFSSLMPIELFRMG